MQCGTMGYFGTGSSPYAKLPLCFSPRVDADWIEERAATGPKGEKGHAATSNPIDPYVVRRLTPSSEHGEPTLVQSLPERRAEVGR
jgi:hypothetical protein